MTYLIKNQNRLAFMCREISRAGGYSPECRAYLKRTGLKLSTIIAHAGFLTVTLAKFYGGNSGDRAFTVDQDGTPAAVIEALLFDHGREQVTADYVAWPLTDPESFATAMGANDGADVLGPQNMVERRGSPLMVHRTPLAWLQAGCEGCVLLKPGARHWLHRAGGPFIAEDADHGLDLRELLGANAFRHRILVPKHARAA